MLTHLKISILAVLAILSTVSTTWAGTSGYQCTVKSELHLNDDGSLAPYPQPLALGKMFAVDRNTGHFVETDQLWWFVTSGKATVLSHGNTGNSFVATYAVHAAENGIFHTTLSVDEFTSGVVKPFLLSAGGSVYAGICD